MKYDDHDDDDHDDDDDAMFYSVAMTMAMIQKCDLGSPPVSHCVQLANKCNDGDEDFDNDNLDSDVDDDDDDDDQIFSFQ